MATARHLQPPAADSRVAPSSRVASFSNGSEHVIGRFRYRWQAERALSLITAETSMRARFINIYGGRRGSRNLLGARARDERHGFLVAVWGTSPSERLHARTLLGVQGAVEIRGPAEDDRAPVPSFSSEAPRLRAHWIARFARLGATWNDHERRYLFGWQMANRPSNRERTWEDAKSEMRSEWERRTPLGLGRRHRRRSRKVGAPRGMPLAPELLRTSPTAGGE